MVAWEWNNGRGATLQECPAGALWPQFSTDHVDLRHHRECPHHQNLA